VLTFDDGYRSDYEVAFPVLQAQGFRAVHFLYVKKLSQAIGLTNAEIQELLTAGHEVGNHTYNHTEIHTAGQQKLIQETQQAKDALEEMLDIEIVSFCYPVGRYNSDGVSAVEASGHKVAVTTAYGYASPEQGLLTLNRIRINRSDGLQGFIKKLQPYEELTPVN
jgi:peptidoglycan/xylan/chitin deacetylase (PgdA/CDA1 family)